MKSAWDGYINDAKRAQTILSGSFTCALCSNKPAEEHKTHDKVAYTLREECYRFLESLDLSPHKKQIIQEKTITQRESERWIEERKKRITASNFGKICKARSEAAKIKLAKDLINIGDLSHLPAIQHGVLNEDNAIRLYEEKTNVNVVRSGLKIHKDIGYLAGSPDGLIGLDGIIEVKCPATIKSINNIFKLTYLHDDGKLRISHHYYFQVQGLLEVMNRPWCDFIIYVPNDLKVERITRNSNFWKNVMLPKLRVFYLFYYLPEFLRPNSKLTQIERRWCTDKGIMFLSNGLVDDSRYYENMPCRRDYTIAVYEEFDLHIKELKFSDFDSLSG